MLHGHGSWEPFWPAFGGTLFVYRNPLDTLLGTWYATVHFSREHRGTIAIDDYVIARLDAWADQYAACAPAADATLCYERLMADALAEFRRAFSALGVSYADDDLRQAVGISGFDSIRAMEDRAGQRHGHRTPGPDPSAPAPSPWFDEPGVRFTRSGKIGQWKTELKPDTVKAVERKLKRRGIALDRFVLE